MSKLEGTRLACPVGQRPNAQRFDGMSTLEPFTVSRTVNVERVVFVSAVSYERNAALPSRFIVNVPARGMVRPEYSPRISPTIGLPSLLVAIGRVATSLVGVGSTSPSHPASTIV